MNEMDLTRGSVPKTLMRFALPFLLANVLQALYGGADLFVVGQYDDAASVAGVAIGSQVLQAVTGVILGLTAGTTILIAMAVGAKDDQKAASVIGTSVYFFAAVGIVLTLLMTLFHRQVAELMHTPPEAMEDTLHYLFICACGIPFIMGYNVVCGILRGLGDSKSPLYFVGLACIINIGLDFVLVGGFGMRAAGAAVATVASQGISFFVSLWSLWKKGFRFEMTRSSFALDSKVARRIVALGSPIALQTVLVDISFLIITVIVNQMGVIPSASLGVVEKLIVFAMLPPAAISAALAAMTAQNYGAGLVPRMKRTLWAGTTMALAFGVPVWAYSQFFGETLTGLFTHEAAVRAMAAGYLQGYSLDCVLVSFIFCANAYFSGQGNSLFPMLHSMIATFLFRIPLSYLFGQVDPTSLDLMGFAPPLASVSSVLICLWYLRSNTKKLEHMKLPESVKS